MIILSKKYKDFKEIPLNQKFKNIPINFMNIDEKRALPEEIKDKKHQVICYRCKKEILEKERRRCLEYNRLTDERKRIDLCPECAKKVDNKKEPR